MIPVRSDTAKSAKSVFFEDVNDIDIYIEDTALGYKKLFSIMFSRVFSGKYRIENVFPIGDRKSVIKRHESHVNNGRPSIYIIDGDLFILTGEEIHSTAGLFKLPFYCVENLLCDSEAIIDLFDEEEPLRSRDEIQKEFDYPLWVNNNSAMLFDLFVEYAVSFKVNPSVQTVAYSVKNVVSSGNGDVCSIKIGQRISELKLSSVSVVGEDEYEKVKDSILKNYSLTGVDPIEAVSGKDYLFPLLKMRAKSIVKTTIPDINLKMRLAKKCDLTSLADSENYVLC